MSGSTERTPLTGGVPTSIARNRRVAIGVGIGLTVALVLGATLALLRPTTFTETSSPISPQLLNGSEPWSCGHTPYDTGYIKLANKKDDYYFYWFVQSSSTDPSKDPLVLWLTGGAGGSSLSALLTENGPCTVNADGKTTTQNPYSWTQHANIIWLDQPTGTGFSYSNAIDVDADVDNLKVRIGENIYWFLQGFLNKHPEFDGREFFISGESYAGHYIPSAGHFILQENRKSNRKHINLQGVSIGNALVDPVIQYAHVVDMAIENRYNITTLTDAQIAQMKAEIPRCTARTKECQTGDKGACADALDCFGNKFLGPFVASKRNSYDIRKSCEDTRAVGSLSVCGLDYDTVQQYLSQPIVRKALHVEPSVADWVIIRPDVAQRFYDEGDFGLSYTDFTGELLDNGVRVLLYNGDADLVCNVAGGDAWTRALNWTGQADFNAAKEHALVTTNNTNSGLVHSFGALTYIQVFNSGHMVPQDQPAVAFDMIHKFYQNQPL